MALCQLTGHKTQQICIYLEKFHIYNVAKRYCKYIYGSWVYFEKNTKQTARKKSPEITKRKPNCGDLNLQT